MLGWGIDVLVGVLAQRTGKGMTRSSNSTCKDSGRKRWGALAVGVNSPSPREIADQGPVTAWDPVGGRPIHECSSTSGAGSQRGL